MHKCISLLIAVLVAALTLPYRSSSAAGETTLQIQVPIWNQVDGLDCQEVKRIACFQNDMTCKLQSGSALWKIDFRKNSAYSVKLAHSLEISGYVHRNFDLLGTAIHKAILSDGGFIEFHDFNRGNGVCARLTLLQTLAESIVAITFDCRSAK